MTEILIAVGAVTAVGLICGIVIAVASKVMEVKENETVKKLRECLPGANCGACGFTGCDSYAKALADGAKTNLCIPGADITAQRIANVLGVKAENVVEMVAIVGCNGHCEATGNKQIYQGMSSCSAASLLYGGTGKCTHGCLGYGDCVAACPNDAICVKDSVARISPNRCVGCGMCANACPKHLITLVPDVRRTVVLCHNHDKAPVARRKCTNACIGCRKCEKSCENGAIHVINELATIDFEKCVDCGKCSEVCPVGCIHVLDLTGEHAFVEHSDI